jgi:hypothetical protein
VTAQKIVAQSAYLLKKVSLVLRGQRAQDAQPQRRKHLRITIPIVSTKRTHAMLLTVRKWQFRYGTKKIHAKDSGTGESLPFIGRRNAKRRMGEFNVEVH